MPTRNLSSPPFQPVERQTIIDMVVLSIEALVRSGELRLDSRLPSEPRLAEMLQISRVSLREALKSLIYLGLLKARPGEGIYLHPSLTSMTTRHLQWMLLLKEIRYLELHELRELLEPAAAAFAAQRATSDDIKRMEAVLERMKRTTSDPEAFVRLEFELHRAILQASKNGALQSTMKMLYTALSEEHQRVLPPLLDIVQNCARHERICWHISQNDATGARLAVIADLDYATSLLQKSMLEQ